MVLSVFFILLTAEIFCRITLKPIDLFEITGKMTGNINYEEFTDAFCAFKGRPNYVYKKREFKTINNFGFISTPNLTLEKPKNTIRIVFLGESSTAGVGYTLSDNETWPWQVIEIIKKQYPNLNIEFINGALGGYTTFESFGRLWSRIRFFKPDIVCVCHGWNDMYYFTKEKMDNIVSWRTQSDGDWNYNIRKLKIIEPFSLDEIFRYSQLLTRLRLKFSFQNTGETGNYKSHSKQYDIRGLEVFRENLRLIKMSTNLMGTKLFVCKQPTLIVSGLSLEQQKRCRLNFHNFNFQTHLDAFTNIYRVIDEEIDHESIIDLTSISGVPEYFSDHIHPTREGAKKIASLVSKKIIQSLVSH